MPFLILFVIIPLVELGIFAAVSDHIGLGSALIFALFTAVLGGYLVKLQGIQTMVSMRQNLDKGRIPTDALFDGFCLIAAGALLITPGFLTDLIGFSLLIPPLRKTLHEGISKHTNWGMDAQGFNTRRSHDPDIIEGEYEEIIPEDAVNNNDQGDNHKHLR